MVSCILGCRQAPRARPRPPDAGTTVTVYVPPKSAERLAGRLQVIAAKCPVHRTLDGEVIFTERVESVAPAAT